MLRIKNLIYIPCFLFLLSCGGGSGSNRITVLSDYYSKIVNNGYCIEYGLNDNDEVTLVCGVIDESDNSETQKIIRLSPNGEFKEYPLPVAISNNKFIHVDPIKQNGKFFVFVSSLIIDDFTESVNLEPRKNKLSLPYSAPEYFIWNGRSYDKIDGYINASSDNGRFFSVIKGNFDSPSRQLLLDGDREIELKSNDGTYPFQLVFRLTNTGNQYGPGYNDKGVIEDNLVWNVGGQRVLNRPVDSEEKRFYQLNSINNKDNLLFDSFPISADELSKAEVYIQYKDNSVFKKEVDLPALSSFVYDYNDNDLVVINHNFENYIFSPKSGLKNIRDFIDPDDQTTVYSLLFLNNRNKAVVTASFAEGGNKVLLVDLGNF